MDQDSRVGEHSCMATCQVPGQTYPCARNTFVLSKYVPERPSVSDLEFHDDILRYGQKIRVHMGPAYANGESWQLFSKIVCPTHFAKHSHHQLVGMTTRMNYETVWQVGLVLIGAP